MPPRVVKVGFDAPATILDLQALPRAVDMLREDVRTGFDLIGIKFDQAFAKLEKRLDAQDARIVLLERDVAEIKAKVGELDKARRIDKSRSGERRGKKNS